MLISDWSGLFIEYYVFNKNILLVDSEKILNKEYKLLKNKPAEIRLRTKISKSFSFNNLENIVPEIKKLIKKRTITLIRLTNFILICS